MPALEEPVTQPVPPPPAPVPAVGEQTTPTLVADIADDAGTLVTQTANLFQAEMRDGFRQIRWWALAAFTGGVLLAAGLLFALVAVVFGLNSAYPTLPMWACWLIVGIAMLVVGGVFAALGLRYVVSVNLVPHRTFKSLSETLSWLVKRSK
jgi:hypothetical protein